MSLDRDFLKFTAGPGFGERERIRVTINSKGEIYMNRKTFVELGKPEAVSLYYSASRQMIAIEPANRRHVESFSIRQRVPGIGGYYIPAARLCRHYRIEIKQCEAFTRPEITGEGILLLNLKETTVVGGWTVDGTDAQAKREEKLRLREERRAERERKQLARAQEQEAARRQREQQQRQRESAKKTAAEIAKRGREIANFRKKYGTDPNSDQPVRKYRAAGF